MARLKNSALLVGLNFDENYPPVLADCEKMIRKNQLDKGGLRVTLSKNTKKDSILITARENHYEDETFQHGVSIGISDYARNEQSLLVTVKSNNYLENLLILNESKSKGFNEAIFFNSKGHLAEGSMSNIFFIKNEKVYTPSRDNGLLSGIVRNKVIELLKHHEIPFEEGYYRKEVLMEADEIFITNSLMEIMPVRRVEDLEYPVKNESFTNHLKKMYKKEYDII